MQQSAENDVVGTRLHLAGRWAEPLSGEYIESLNPATGRRNGLIAAGTPAEIATAVEAAENAQADWEWSGPFGRAAVLRRIAEVCSTRRERLARLLCEDQGKPLEAEAYAEVDGLIDYFRWSAEDAVRIEGVIGATSSTSIEARLYRRARGVVGVITPWNWPYTMAAQVIAPALAAGNAVVWVPAPSTSVCSELLAQCIVDAGLPSGVFGFVTGHGPVVGDALAGSDGISSIAFVGSGATGRKVAERAAGKHQVLELGSNGPTLVLADADLELAAEAVLDSAFLCAGQSCTAAERLLVERPVREEFEAILVEKVRTRVKLGHPKDPETTMGPLNNEGVAAKMDAHVADAVARGATVLIGGHRESGLGSELYWQPTVLSGVSRDAAVAFEETFGPIVPIIEVESLEDAIEVTNSNPEGLVSSIFTSDVRSAREFRMRTRTGGLNINLSSNYYEIHLAFGGAARSSSGTGRVGGKYGLDEFSEYQIVYENLGED